MTVPKCGAKTRNGGTCAQKAGWGTDHVGEGRCKLHGGLTPIKHGRYSKITRPRLKELIEQFASEKDPLDITSELHLLRALVLDYIERHDQFTEALIAWHSSFGEEYRQAYGTWREAVIRKVESEWRDTQPDDLPDPPDPSDYERKPRQVIDILAVGNYIDKIGRMVERIEKMRAEGSITLETLDRVLEQLGVEVVKAAQEEVRDATQRAALLKAIERRWATIRVDAPTRPRSEDGARVVN